MSKNTAEKCVKMLLTILYMCYCVCVCVCVCERGSRERVG